MAGQWRIMRSSEDGRLILVDIATAMGRRYGVWALASENDGLAYANGMVAKNVADSLEDRFGTDTVGSVYVSELRRACDCGSVGYGQHIATCAMIRFGKDA